jgi:hypothetical protein
VFTNRWYPQGPPIILGATAGEFSGRVLLGGTGAQRCAHVVRARLFAPGNRLLESAMSYDVTRVSAGGGDTPCAAITDQR